jgi:hypothetical protein
MIRISITNKKLFFTYLNNRELDLDKSEISKLYKILSSEYDNVDHAVSTTLKHKIVFEEIVKMSNRKVNIKKEKERIVEKEKKTNFFNNIIQSIKTTKNSFSSHDHAEEREEDSKEEEEDSEEPFIELPCLINNLNKNNNSKYRFEKEQVESILEDLHKLGLIVYFFKKSLSDTIISNPQWFNNVLKSIIDIGRKRVQIVFESLYNNLKEKSKNKRLILEFSKEINRWKGNFLEYL